MATDGWLAAVSTAPGSELRDMCMACVRSSGVDGAALAVLAGDGTPETLHATDALAARIEDLQFTTGEGPSVEATRSGAPVFVPHLNGSASARWPALGSELRTAGVGAIFALPIRVGAVSLGCLDLYRRSPGAMSPGQAVTAVRAVDRVAELILALTEDGLERVTPTTTYRMVVHQAAGMAMMQLNVSVDEAMVVLRATAYAEGQSINSLAADIVSRRRRITKERR
jgi:hypothetical protein